MPKGASKTKDKAQKAPAPVVKRKEDVSTNPLKNPDHRFMQQILTKEASKRESFASKIMTLTRDRNPLLGEETYRETPEYLVANRTQEFAFTKEAMQSLRFQSERQEPMGSAVGLVHSLRQRKEIIESELELMKKIVEHKKLCLSITNEHNIPRTLHPAPQQTAQLQRTSTSADVSRVMEAKQFKQANTDRAFAFENNAVCHLGR